MQIEIGTFEWVVTALGALVILFLVGNTLFAFYSSLGAVVFGQLVATGILNWMDR